jgi:hypothetical protein
VNRLEPCSISLLLQLEFVNLCMFLWSCAYLKVDYNLKTAADFVSGLAGENSGLRVAYLGISYAKWSKESAKRAYAQCYCTGAHPRACQTSKPLRVKLLRTLG